VAVSSGRAVNMREINGADRGGMVGVVAAVVLVRAALTTISFALTAGSAH
jgi:hypothetical protein